MNAAAIQRLVPELFRVIAELEAAAPGRHFTPDGHLIGSIGEVIAADRYGLTLTTASKKGIDAHDAQGRAVEIKCTGKNKSVALRGHEPSAERFIALQINRDGSAVDDYDGPAAPVWAEVAREAHGWDSQTVTVRSKLKRSWKCREGHEWEARVQERTREGRGTGCPYCNGRLPVEGVNDLRTLFPELAQQVLSHNPATKCSLVSQVGFMCM